MEDNDKDSAKVTIDFEDQIKALEDLLPKNLQKMNLLLNPEKKGERKERERKMK